MPHPPLLLASSSRYRRERLQSLGIPFTTASPNVDESPHSQESPQDLPLRLARAKAHALRDQFPGHLIIASDQIAVAPDGSVLTKPGSEARAFKQLSSCRGERVRFLTSLCLLHGGTGGEYTAVEPFEVVFRDLSDTEIRRYLQSERPFDCAGSFKMEGLGIALFKSLEGRDPNSLIGLPLIAMEDGLQTMGLSLLDY